MGLLCLGASRNKYDVMGGLGLDYDRNIRRKEG